MKNAKPSDFIGLFVVLLTWGLYFLKVWPKMLFFSKEGLSAGFVNVWSDWATHFAIANVFALRTPEMWLKCHPFYFQGNFRHHYAASMISGLFMRFGVDEVNAFIIPSIVTTFILLIVLYVFYLTVLKSQWLSYLAVTLFLANGGLGFLWFIKDFLNRPGLEVLKYPPRLYTKLVEENIYSDNFIVSEFLPQRAFLLGLPIALIILMFVLGWIKRGFENVPGFSLLTAGFLVGIMPVVHYFSYLSLLIIFAVQFIFSYKSWKKWSLLLVGIVAGNYFVYYYLFGNSFPSNFFKLYVGWFSNAQKINFLYFWILNWGIFFPLSILATWKLKSYKNPLIISGGLIFILSNIILFSQGVWNNYKMITWTYLILCIPVVQYLKELWKVNNFLVKPFVVLLFFTMTFSGFIDLYNITRTEKHAIVMWTNDEIALAKEFQKISSPSTRVLTADTNNHWVMCLTGRQVLMGGRLKLARWGFNYDQTLKDIQIMFSGSKEAEGLLHKYSIGYVVIGPAEKNGFNANEKYFDENYKVVLEREPYKVYSIQ